MKTRLTDVLPGGCDAAMLENTPLGRLGAPRTWPERYGPVLEDAAFVTGAVLLVDGGLGM